MAPYFDRLTPAMKKEMRREANRRYRDKHREILLCKKREYASRPSTLARRRHLYLHRNDTPPSSPRPQPPPTPTLDLWAKSEAKRAVECARSASSEVDIPRGKSFGWTQARPRSATWILSSSWTRRLCGEFVNLQSSPQESASSMSLE